MGGRAAGLLWGVRGLRFIAITTFLMVRKSLEKEINHTDFLSALNKLQCG